MSLGKLLIAEYDANKRKVLEGELQQAGYEVEAVADGEQALERFKRKCNSSSPDYDPYHMVITEISLPKKDGIEVLGKILGINSKIPVILYTEYANYKDNFLAWSADAYVLKGEGIEGLLRAMESVRERRGIEVKHG